MAKGTKYSQQFKEDAVQYRLDHPELTLRKAAENLGVSESAERIRKAPDGVQGLL
jgi:transposase